MHVRTGERGFETMSMEYQVQENCLTIFLPKEVDHHNAEEVKKSADAIIEKEHIKYVIFDFEQTDFMDSSGIGVIMGRYRMICLIGGEVCPCQCQDKKDPDHVGSHENHANI